MSDVPRNSQELPKSFAELVAPARTALVLKKQQPSLFFNTPFDHHLRIKAE